MECPVALERERQRREAQEAELIAEAWGRAGEAARW